MRPSLRRYGHELASQLWPMHEWEMLRRAWEAGVSVPYPVERSEDGVLMSFIGDEEGAAPKLAQARLDRDELASAWEQMVTNLCALRLAGLVHADLSVYNLLWWNGRLMVIDLPQGSSSPRTPMRSSCCIATSPTWRTGSAGGA